MVSNIVVKTVYIIESPDGLYLGDITKDANGKFSFSSMVEEMDSPTSDSIAVLVRDLNLAYGAQFPNQEAAIESGKYDDV